jgi:hypothetical protein
LVFKKEKIAQRGFKTQIFKNRCPFAKLIIETILNKLQSRLTHPSSFNRALEVKKESLS